MFPNRSRDWHRVATSDDQKRLQDWRSSFVAALASARQSGHGPAIDAEGALLQPDAAIASGAIPNGLYRCRRFRLGAKAAAEPAFAVRENLTCRVSQDGAVQAFVMLGGLQRQIGLILPSDAVHQVFLGTLMLPDERRAMQYGADEQRDVAGLVERIGPRQWRMLLPAPHFGSQFEVVDLVPLGGNAA